MAAAVEGAAAKATSDLGFLRLDPADFARAPQKSIDYAVMEKTDRAAVVAGDFRWSDIGSWDALFDITPPNEHGNVLQGPVVTMDTQDCVIHSDGRLTTVVGVKDLVVVSTSDAVMVVPRARAQEVRELVAKLKGAKRPEATDHKRIHRPWGYYELIDMGERFQVKRIVVIPGGMLSLQKHQHRAEHWVVVRGTAEVTLGERVREVHENELIYIPIGEVHRLDQPRPHSARTHRSADRQLSRRRRHRAAGRYLQARVRVAVRHCEPPSGALGGSNPVSSIRLLDCFVAPFGARNDDQARSMKSMNARKGVGTKRRPG